MPSRVARIKAIGASMLARNAREPSLLAPLPEIAGRRTTSIVDQDVGVRAGVEQCRAALLGRNVGRHHGDRHVVRGPDLGRGGLQRLTATGVDDQLDAVLGQRHRAGAAQPLARRAHDGPRGRESPDPSSLLPSTSLISGDFVQTARASGMVTGRRARSDARSSIADQQRVQPRTIAPCAAPEIRRPPVRADLPVGELLDQKGAQEPIVGRVDPHRPSGQEARAEVGQAARPRQRPVGTRVSSKLPPGAATRFQRWKSSLLLGRSSASSTAQAARSQPRQWISWRPIAPRPAQKPAPARSAHTRARCVLPQAGGPISRQAGPGQSGQRRTASSAAWFGSAGMKSVRRSPSA